MLTGIEVLDLADEKASYCAGVLARLGARVIKIEPPGGDPARQRGPFLEGTGQPGESLSFFHNNANKRGITLDLGEHEGREIFLKRIRRADVLVETFPPGRLEELKLGYEVLNDLNPRLIHASITGFGQHGPRRSYKSCDLVAAACGGAMYVSGSPSTPPLKPGGEQSYCAASLYAALGILLALRQRKKSGRGAYLDLSLQEAVVSSLEHVLVRFFHDGITPERQGNRHWDGTFAILPCRDGFIHMTISHAWETLMEWMASEGMAADLTEDRWKDGEYGRTHQEYILDVLARWTAGHGVEELFQQGQSMGFPWAPVSKPAEVLENPQLQARGFFSPLSLPRLPFLFSNLTLPPLRRPPAVGEDNDLIYQEDMGLSREGSKVSLQASSNLLVPSPCEIARELGANIPRGASSNLLVPSPCEGGGFGWGWRLFMNKGILKGLRILDLTRVMAGPYATRILADFGAEVIKVQTEKTATGSEMAGSGYYNAWNRNKKSITLNLNHEEAKGLFCRLVAQSDGVVENFTPRVMANWGLTYDKLREARADLIMLSMSGMGQTGPRRDFVAYGPTLQSLAGLTYLTSFRPEEPLGLGYAYADPIFGLYGAIGMLVALEHRDKTGEGQHIDLSGFEAACTLIGPILMDVSANKREVPPAGNHPLGHEAAPYGCYRCRGRDRWCVIAVGNEAEWQALCGVVGHPEWLHDGRFATVSQRKKQVDALDALLTDWTKGHSPEEAVAILQGAGIPAGAVESARDLASDPQLLARDYFITLDHPLLGKVLSDNYPFRLPGSGPKDERPAPLLGADNDNVFGTLLGLKAEEISLLKEKGIIG